MSTVFQRWTERATDGVGDLFLVGGDNVFLIYKYDRKPHLGRFALSILNIAGNDFDLYQTFRNKQDWKNAYRLARVVMKQRN